MAETLENAGGRQFLVSGRTGAADWFRTLSKWMAPSASCPAAKPAGPDVITASAAQVSAVNTLQCGARHSAVPARATLDCKQPPKMHNASGFQVGFQVGLRS
jgi:hypothetical protein